jgi:micrococcal nuclease
MGIKNRGKIVYTYQLEITKVYDGDTVNGVVDLGFNIRMDIKIRLANINTPEIRTKDLEEKARGYAARDFLREFLDKFGAGLLVKTTKKGKNFKIMM